MRSVSNLFPLRVDDTEQSFVMFATLCKCWRVKYYFFFWLKSIIFLYYDQNDETPLHSTGSGVVV